ncbi:unnamed protein product [Cyprideis torosa]|uniref:Uncharacterized protein n=1 Tax=Cyprideis torosa TaxID=163714 RepID=A0A7R8WNY6_9CRUS|nr:unnamed protein product [Cyprideis torosa]CAG0906747.1 unnamed protein product [Cyprideis torosa]
MSSPSSSESGSTASRSEKTTHKYTTQIETPTEKHIYELAEKGLKLQLDKKFLINYVSEEGITCEEVLTQSSQLAKSMKKLGLAKGDVVAFNMEGNLKYPIIMLAVLRNGGIIHLMNVSKVKDCLLHEVRETKPKFLFYTESSSALIQELKKEAPTIQATYNISDAGQFQELLQMGAEDHGASPLLGSEEDIAFITYTSGTTGGAKGVLLSHRCIIHCAHAFNHVDWLDRKQTDVALTWVPFQHLSGQGLLMGAMSTGSTLIFTAVVSGDIVSFLKLIEKYKVTIFPLTPYFAKIVLSHPKFRDFNLSSIRTLVIGAAPVSVPLIEKLTSSFPQARIIQGYGQTEAPVCSHGTPRNSMKPGSCGIVMPFYESKVVNESGELAEPGERGIIHVRGPQVMKGYLGDPKKTAEVLDKDGWLNSGDVAYYDTDGYYYIVDREKEMIKFRSFPMSPFLIERTLMEHPAVKDAAVVGKKAEIDGEIPVAFVQKVPGHNVEEEELLNFVKTKLEGKIEISGGIRFVDSIPKTPLGKTKRAEVKQMIREEEEKEQEAKLSNPTEKKGK